MDACALTRSLTILTGTHTRISHSPLWAGVVAAAVCLAAPASSQTSDLRGRVANTQTPTIQQSFVDVKVATLSGLHVVDAVGNDAVANGSLSTPAGRFTLSPHACSGGGLGFGGNASGGANADVALDYAIVSATLPSGTPVSVSVRWAVKSKVMAVGQDMAGINTGCSSIASGQVVIAPNYVPVLNRSGAQSRSHGTYDGIQVITSGTLNILDDSGDDVYTVLVGPAVSEPTCARARNWRWDGAMDGGERDAAGGPIVAHGVSAAPFTAERPEACAARGGRDA